MHMYSKEQYKSEQQPGDQLLGGSTALCHSPGASREKRKKLSERETFNAVEKKGKEGEGEREWGTRINQGYNCMQRAGAERQSKSRWQEIKYCSSTEIGRRETSKHGDS